ncbi:putative endopeptidase [Agromyces flavus]|uniref:Endopeptidase n=1 Tax=Agromyces flavus TaxID=589382 RepID=A0A1H1YKX4_9MICO|nr:M13-type metalloendopeptidase [Agromyces flavus]MCP2366726.1 putative endopeptidase [Agromyces flavus]GGI45249.1 peptidase M13 [Agromyces flavus]SDT22100.1 putative endopeptidase [Agromyces flavus]
MSAATTPSGIILDELDPDVRPQDDLFRHVNGKWIARTEIPADKARYGSFIVLYEEAEKAVREIIQEAQGAEPGTEARKVGDLYASFMNEERAELLGATPIAAQLVEASLPGSVEQLLETAGRLERQGVSGFAQLFVDNDPGDPERYLVFVEQGGIGLPDESYYREERFGPIREKYLAHLERMFGLAKLADPAGRARRVFDLETEIAASHWTNVDSRDSQKTYNLMPWADVAAAASVDLDVWRDAMGVPARAFDELVVRQPSFVEGVGRLLTDDRLPAWRDWLAWQVVRSSAAYLSSDFVEANFDFYGRTLTGTPELRERWKRGVSFVEASVGEAVGRIYVERHFPPAAKEAMDELVENLVEAYRQSISELDWMGEETRAKALDKLEKFTPKIGYPVKWRDYSTMAVSADDLVANVRAAAEFEFHRQLGKIGQPIDRDEWFMTPQTINAYYNPGFNEIVFPAAILQFPFFDAERDAASNYGAIGAVIGHEIGHGFDDQGSRFDGDGRLIDWWTEADRAAFEERTKALIDQYDVLVPEQLEASSDGEHHVNGALTIGENIGDLGGLAIAWKAYQLSLGGTTPPVIDGLSGAQRFFLSWAQAWQLKGRDEEVIRLLAIDPHSPNEFRCNQIVRNIDEFYTGFEVTSDDALWLDPAERVRIW